MDDVPPSALDVLVVDDNLGSAFMIEQVLKRAGHRVRVAVGGNEAVRLASMQTPDAIVMDINLPDLGGFEAAKRIRTLLAHQVKIVGISGRDIPVEPDGTPPVLDARLHKPFRPETLLQTLDRVVATDPSRE